MVEAQGMKFNNEVFEIVDAKARAQLNNIANQLGKNEDDSFKTLETNDKTIIGAINEVFQNASNGKKLIADAITGKGVQTSSEDTFKVMATNISNINNIDNAIVQIKGITYRLNKVNDEIIATKIAGMEDLLEGRILLWNDDFEGTEVDLKTWTFDDRDKYGSLLNSWTGGAKTTVKDSILNIKAKKETYGSYTAEWSSDQLWTRKKYANNPCRFECKMKFDVMNGCWPAFWLMGNYFTGTGPEAGEGGLAWPKCGEIDIMEFMGGANGNLSSTVHWANLSDDTHQKQNLGTFDANDVTDWHIYGCEITDTQITFDIDGVIHDTFDLSTADVDFGNALKLPMYPLISLQVGQSGGTPDNDATEMNVYVDWVRCYAPVDTTVYGEVESISITGIDTTVVSGVTQVATVEFTPSIANNKILNWSSSNEEIVTVKNGVITSIADGEAIITVTAKNGISTSITITVESIAEYPVTGLAFDKTWFPVVVGNKYTPNLEITPNYTTDNINYSSSDEKVFTVNNSTGEITPIASGSATLTATSDSGITTSMTIDIISQDESAYIHATFNGTTYQSDTGIGNCTKASSKSFVLPWEPRDTEYTLVMILTGIDRSASLGFGNSDSYPGTNYKPSFVGNYNTTAGTNYIGVYSEKTFETINLSDLTLPTTLKLAYVVKNNTISYYKNGVLFGSHKMASIGNSGIKTPTTHLGIRTYSTTGTSEMLFYRRALSDTEAIAITTL